jgi:hypothetical protein
MARKEITVTIATEGRDQGKRFKITEMSAAAGERWAIRAFLALARSGVVIPDYVQDMGWAGMATIGLRAFAGISYELAQPLLDEMLQCVQIVEPNVTRGLTEDDVEEIATYVELRREVFQLHVDFSKVAGHLKSRQATGGSSPSDTQTSGLSSD